MLDIQRWHQTETMTKKKEFIVLRIFILYVLEVVTSWTDSSIGYRDSGLNPDLDPAGGLYGSGI